MAKEIIAVFQDCVLCGVKGRKKIAEYAKKGIIIRKVGFTTEEGKDLIHKAVFEHHIGQMPFYTDGVIFTTNLQALVENRIKTTETIENFRKAEKKPVSTKKKKSVKTGRVVVLEKDVENGSNTEV